MHVITCTINVWLDWDRVTSVLSYNAVCYWMVDKTDLETETSTQENRFEVVPFKYHNHEFF